LLNEKKRKAYQKVVFIIACLDHIKLLGCFNNLKKRTQKQQIKCKPIAVTLVYIVPCRSS